MGPKPNNWFCRRREEDTETQARRPCDTAGRHGDAATSCLGPPKAGEEARKGSSSEPPQRARPCCPPDFRLLASRTVRTDLLIEAKFEVICYGSSRKLMYKIISDQCPKENQGG